MGPVMVNAGNFVTVSIKIMMTIPKYKVIVIGLKMPFFSIKILSELIDWK